MRIATVRDIPDSIDGWPRDQRADVILRRDGDRLDISMTYLYLNSRAFRDRSHKYRSVITKEICISSMRPLSRTGPPRSGIASRRWNEWFSARGLNETTGGALDGYFPPSKTRRVAELMSEANDLWIEESEVVQEKPCKVVRAVTPYGKYAMWIAESLGCVPLKVTYDLGPNDYLTYRDDRPFGETHVSTPDGRQHVGKKATGVLENVRVERIKDTFIPVGGKFTVSFVYGDIKILHINTYQRSEIELNPCWEGTDAFVMDLPEGTRVTNMDDPNSGVLYGWHDGKIKKTGEQFGGELAVGSWEDRPAVYSYLWAGLGVLLLCAGMQLTFGKTWLPRAAGPNANAVRLLVIGVSAGILALLPEPAWAAGELPAQLRMQPAAKPPDMEPYCGVQSLYRALRALGKDIRFVDLLKPEYISSRRGSTGSDLQRAGQEFGVFVEPMNHMTCDMLRQLHHPVILHVKPDLGSQDYTHWLLFMGTAEGKAKLYDEDQPATLMNFDELAARWDGIGLLVSDSPISKSAIWATALFPFLPYAGCAAFAVGLLSQLEQRYGRTHTASGSGLARKSLAQASFLLVLALLAVGGQRMMSHAGYIFNPEASAAIEDYHLGNFLPKVTPQEADQLVDMPDVVVVDARIPRDYQMRHLKGAINIPGGSSRDKCRQALASVSPGNRILVYAHTGGCPFSTKVSRELIALGYHNIVILRGGWVEWVKSHPPPEKERDS